MPVVDSIQGYFGSDDCSNAVACASSSKIHKYFTGKTKIITLS